MTGLRTGRQAFAEQLVAAGVRHVFGNPGTTEQAFIDVLQDYPLDFVLALHEGVAVGAAEGYARRSGEPAFVLLHTAPGLGNAMGMLSNAVLGRTPMVVYVGDMPRSSSFGEPALSGPILDMARTVSRWAWRVDCVDDLPQAVRRAFKVAVHERGPVILVVPSDVMDEPTAAPVCPPDLISRARTPDPAALSRAADTLARAERPAIVVADEIAEVGGQAAVGALAARLGAPVYQGYATEVAVAPDDPFDAGALPLFGGAGPASVLAGYDCVLALGTHLFKQAFAAAGPPLPLDVDVIHIGLDAWELAKNQPAQALEGDPAVAAADLDRLLKDRLDPDRVRVRRSAVEALLRDSRDRRASQARAGWDDTPLSASRAVHTVLAELTADTVVVDEAVSAQPWVAVHRRHAPGTWLRSRGGGLGAGMSLPVGVALAEPDAPVVSLVGDGSALYTITALWTAAHLRLRVLWVVLDNGGYRMLKLNTASYLGPDRDPGRPFVGADLHDPMIDFVGLADGMGVGSARVTSFAELGAAVRKALETDGPTLLQVMVDGSGP